MRSPLFHKMLLASLLLGAPALAAEPTRRVLRMRYSEDAQAASCPGEAALRERIQLRTGDDLFREDAAEEVEVTIGPRGGDLAATIRYRDAGGRISTQRQFSVPNGDAACRVLTDHLALSIAFTLTPFATSRPAPLAAPGEPAAAPPAPPLPPLRPGPEDAKGRAWYWTSVGAGGLAGVVNEELFVGLSWFFRAHMTRDITASVENRLLVVVPGEGARAGAPPAGEGSGQGAASTGGSAEAGERPLDVLVGGALAVCLHPTHLLVTCGVTESRLVLLDPPTDIPRNQLGRFSVSVGARVGVELTLDEAVSLYAHTELLAAIMRPDTSRADLARGHGMTASLGIGVLRGL